MSASILAVFTWLINKIKIWGVAPTIPEKWLVYGCEEGLVEDGFSCGFQGAIP
jgi:hypothetical protein